MLNPLNLQKMNVQMQVIFKYILDVVHINYDIMLWNVGKNIDINNYVPGCV